jgi:hypothetical protein
MKALIDEAAELIQQAVTNCTRAIDDVCAGLDDRRVRAATAMTIVDSLTMAAIASFARDEAEAQWALARHEERCQSLLEMMKLRAEATRD